MLILQETHFSRNSRKPSKLSWASSNELCSARTRSWYHRYTCRSTSVCFYCCICPVRQAVDRFPPRLGRLGYIFRGTPGSPWRWSWLMSSLCRLQLPSTLINMLHPWWCLRFWWGPIWTWSSDRLWSWRSVSCAGSCGGSLGHMCCSC